MKHRNDPSPMPSKDAAAYRKSNPALIPKIDKVPFVAEAISVRKHTSKSLYEKVRKWLEE